MRYVKSMAFACARIRWRYPIIGLMLITAFSWHCSSKTDGPGAHVSGRVLDDSSGIPIDSAWVAEMEVPEESQRIYTDSTGYFEYPAWRGQSFYLYASKAGYRTEKRWVDTAPGSVTVEFRLKKL